MKRNQSGPAILQVIPRLDAGGAERTTLEVAEKLIQEGCRALVASEGGRLEAQLAGFGGELFVLPLNSKSPATLLVNMLALARIIREKDVKLVHARSRAPAWSARLAAARTGIPFVTTYHGIYNARSRLKRFYNSVMVRSDAVIANSQWTADHIVREHGIARERIHVIPRGVDLNHFDPARIPPQSAASFRKNWQASDDDIVFLLPGRLTRWKGQSILIAALAELRKQGRIGHMRAVLAGDPQGRREYEAELGDAIAREKLDAHVMIAPHIATSDMPAAYVAADVVVSASTDPEAFGRVAAEASAMQRPVIATDHGGARETIRDNVSGLLVPPGDPQALAGAMLKMAEGGADVRARMGREGRAHIAGNFTKERMCAATWAVYQELLNRGTHRPAL